MENYNEELLTQEQMEVLAKRDAIKKVLIDTIVGIIGGFIIILLFYFFQLDELLTNIVVMFILLMIAGTFYHMYNHLVDEKEQQLKDRQSEEFCKCYLPPKKQVEVVPIKVEDYEQFILAMIDKASFFAVSNSSTEDDILIYIYLYEEEKPMIFDVISKKDFLYYYKLK